MKFCIAAMLVVLLGANMLCAEEPEPIEGALDGRLRLLEPVDIDAPFPVATRLANPGDHVLLQVAYDSQGATPVAVNVSTSSEALSVVGTLGAGEGPACCYLVMRANEIGSCVATLTYEMNDGSSRTVPFAISLLTEEDEAARVAADEAQGEKYAWIYAARQEGAVVTLTLTGASDDPTMRVLIKVRSTEAEVPEFEVSTLCLDYVCEPAFSPFFDTAQVTSEERVDFVCVYGSMRGTFWHIPVEQVPAPAE